VNYSTLLIPCRLTSATRVLPITHVLLSAVGFGGSTSSTFFPVTVADRPSYTAVDHRRQSFSGSYISRRSGLPHTSHLHRQDIGYTSSGAVLYDFIPLLFCLKSGLHCQTHKSFLLFTYLLIGTKPAWISDTLSYFIVS